MLEDWLVALAGAPWALVVLYLLTVVDGIFPPVPSESAVIALAALAVSTGEPALWLVAAVAAAGAFSGDLLAFSIGRHIPVRRMRLLASPRAQRMVDRAERALAHRGAAFILAARYVPVGRVAVNLTAGSVGYPRRRFTGLAALAGISWSVYSVLLGVGAGVWFADHPVLAVVVGVLGGLLLGLVLDALLRRLVRGRGPRTAADAVPGTPPRPLHESSRV
ncbi:VTT domain-containing protein [Actinotalea sp. BY-33]|uniref:VTT domain-containing protein n=1 Tax=Actinotalea soli TaxID=2819234 RepID=A0A939LR56_9CELL|nr:VTT domain-containing protein [Actinotalea soli]